MLLIKMAADGAGVLKSAEGLTVDDVYNCFVNGDRVVVSKTAERGAVVHEQLLSALEDRRIVGEAARYIFTAVTADAASQYGGTSGDVFAEYLT